MTSYARAPIGEVPRLISEFGAADRRRPEDDASKLYPTLFHHSAWAAVFSGQAGTPMDWDDGKQFGELRWRSRDGIFSRKNYPIDHVEQILALRRFLGETSPEDLAWCGERDARVKIEPEGEARVHALCETRRGGRVCGWIFSRGEGARFSVSGLAPGEYALTWYDPWTGRRVPGAASRLKVDGTGTAKVVADDVMTALRTAAEGFPSTTRLDRGKDAAFKIEAVLAP